MNTQLIAETSSESLHHFSEHQGGQPKTRDNQASIFLNVSVVWLYFQLYNIVITYLEHI